MSAPRDNRELDLAILRAARDFHERRGPMIDKALEGRWPEKVIYRRLQRLDDKGFLYVGFSTLASPNGRRVYRLRDGSASPSWKAPHDRTAG